MTKTMCIAAAIKQAKDLEAEKTELLDAERRTNVQEEVNGEMVLTGPAYNFSEAQCKLGALDENIRNIKHAINVANATIPIASLGMTPDCVLVSMAQKNKRLAVLKAMSRISQRERRDTYGRANQEVYAVRQFDSEDVKKAAEELQQEIRELQLELDRYNLMTEVTFSITQV